MISSKLPKCSLFRVGLENCFARKGLEQTKRRMTQVAESAFAAPDHVKGMTKLDRTQFKKTISLPYLTVEKKHLNSVMPLVKPYLTKLRKFMAVRDVADDESVRQVMLSPDKIKSIEDLPEKLRDTLKTFNQEVLGSTDIELTYDHFKVEDIFRKVLPENSQGLSSFSIIGHIIHLNLKDELIPYKHFIGEVLIDKNQPTIKLVVNKVKSIENEFRFFPMEVLASKDGCEDTTVEVHHANCVFKFDFAKVYWNPRLNTEHERIAKEFRKGHDVLYDVFAGVGPFAIPISKMKCRVLANDLNPESFKALKDNSKLNKVEKFVTCFNLDGRQFIKNEISKDIVSEWRKLDKGEETVVRKFHVTMNLPALATEFLDAFKGWLDDYRDEVESFKEINLPIIHCYCFLKGVFEDPEKEVIAKAEKSLGVALNSEDILQIVEVRKVAPNKDMYRISFKLPLLIWLTAMGKNKKGRKPGNTETNVFRVADGRAKKAKNQKTRGKILKKVRTTDDEKISHLNESVDVIQEDVRKKPEILEPKLNELKRTDYTDKSVNVDEAIEIFNKL
ncbi:tRNA (guanine(37)-N1)-methyltransferase [Halotydeus destructor]|nr:tRNA (guanine(37)-N1)-methyltransferase [Halotydeus destructor]